MTAALAAAVAIPLLGIACQSARPSQPSGPEASGSTEARITIGTEQYGQTVAARLNDIVVVKLGSGGPGWAVEFDSGVLKALGSEESLRNPGPEGWLFRCVGTGTSEMVFTAPAAPCPAGTICPPAQLEFHARVDVR